MGIRCGLNWLRGDAAEASVSIIRMVSEMCLWYIFVATVKTMGDHGSTVVKVLCYKSEGRWFDPS